MRRKYDLRNKKSFIIILILAILVIGVFSLFIYRYNKASKIVYSVETGSVVQDTNKNYLKIEQDAELKIRWNGNYYLVYQTKKIPLGKRVIIYNEITGKLNLYGDFYEIQEDGKIVKHQSETVLPNTTQTKFYKLADREYLLVDREIKSSDNFTKASNYLLVELDKMGNAKLSNNKINLKTITETVLVTSKYQFDINNEILNFGKYDIDLKKIIGTSNQYKPPEKGSNETDGSNQSGGTTDGNTTGNNQNGTGIGNGVGNGTGTGTGTGVINNNPPGEDTNLEEIKSKTKMTSIINFYAGLTQINVDYVVYDPYNEYKSVYAEVMKAGKLEVIHLSKTDTHIVFNDLLPDTEYEISFVYTTTDTNGELVRNTFDRLTLKTIKPTYSIEVNRISSVTSTITYKINLQNGYKINKANVNLAFSYFEIDPESGVSTKKQASLDKSVTIPENVSSVLGTFDIAGYNIDENSTLKLTITSVEGTSGKINIDDASKSFRWR